MNRIFLKSGFIAGLVLFTTGCISLSGSGPQTSGPAGAFITQDKGEEWKSISFVPTVGGNKNFSASSVFKFVGDPKDPKTMYWLTRGQGLLYSYDEGRSWNQAAEPLNQGFIYDIALHPKDSCTIYATNGRNVYKSVNCSRSWTAVYREGRPSTIVRSVELDPFGENHVYILTSNGDLLKSVDQGTSWSANHRFSEESVTLEFDRNREGLMYVATRADGLHRSFNGGGQWTNVSDPIETKTGVLTYRGFHVFPNEAGHIYWISDFGILVSRNAGSDWDQIELITPPGGAQLYAFTVNPQDDNDLYYTATINAKSTLYRSSDRGQSWVTKRLPSAQYPTALHAHATQDGWVYLGFTILDN